MDKTLQYDPKQIINHSDTTNSSEEDDNHVCFRGEWDAEGVYVYQAYRPEIADWAVTNQTFGGPLWKPHRMTWIKPSLAWMLYRSGYGHKKGQDRILKIKLSHDTMATLLSHCKCVDTNRNTKLAKMTRITQQQQQEDGHVGGVGRIQWDPERDLFQADPNKKVPRRMLRQRAIQIGLAGSLSEYYVDHILSIEDVTQLAHVVGEAHKATDTNAAMESLLHRLPKERSYLPVLAEEKLRELAMLRGPARHAIEKIGRGRCVETIPNSSYSIDEV